MSSAVWPLLGNADTVQTRLKNNRPYEHDIFADVLTAMIARGRQAPLHRYPERFTVAWQGEEHNEISKAMLALAATAVSSNVSIY